MQFFETTRTQHKTTFAFSTNELDRNAANRSDQNWYESLRKSKNTRFVLFFDNKIVVCSNGSSQRVFFTRAEAEQLRVEWKNSPYLGGRERVEFFCASILNFDEAMLAEKNLYPIGLRTLAIESAIPDHDLSVLAQAAALNHWHSSHQFCACCGQPTYLTEAGYRRDCLACGSEHFPRTDPAVIMLVIAGENCLLGSTGRFAEGMYSTLAGFVEPGETLENAVRREVFEESGIKVGRVKYLFSQPWPFPANIMIGCIAEALTTKISFDSDELIDCRWFSKDEVSLMSSKQHPENLTIPPKISIASALIQEWNNSTS